MGLLGRPPLMDTSYFLVVSGVLSGNQWREVWPRNLILYRNYGGKKNINILGTLF
jgi:hypothetical protein